MTRIFSDPYRLLFLSGLIALLWGVGIWLPQIWQSESYPVIFHRYLMLNGFVALYIAGFLMTAIPKFSKTKLASTQEIMSFFFLTALGTVCAYQELDSYIAIVSAAQALLLMAFIMKRIKNRKENVPFSFIFIPIGLVLWLFSSFGPFLDVPFNISELHYEGVLSSIILGVGIRLIPGILGHQDIVQKERAFYERPVSLLQTIPKAFWPLFLAFTFSYFIPSDHLSNIIQSICVVIVAFSYWKLYKLPKEKGALYFCLWLTAWVFVFSFILKVLWPLGASHASHAFLIGAVVLLCILIGTRVVVSHGPGDKELEKWRGLYWVTGLVLLAMSTRVSAYLMPDLYFSHLGYGAFVLMLAIVIWLYKYLRCFFK
jgi:uncharacterized protein involved in response to NO